MPTFSSQLIARAREYKSKSQHAAAVRPHLEKIERAVDAFDAFVSKTRSNKELTPEGQTAAIRRFAEGGLIPVVRDAERAIASAQKALDGERKSIGHPAYDKTDIVSALQRAELRSYLASLSPAEALAKALENSDFADAFLEQPPELSGLNVEAVNTVLKSINSDAFNEIEQAEEELARIKNVAGEGRRFIAETGFASDENETNKWIEKVSDTPEESALKIVQQYGPTGIDGETVMRALGHTDWESQTGQAIYKLRQAGLVVDAGPGRIKAAAA
ncbi:MAG: hypothetical protein Tsb0016_07410 [Sphingomonadales bacterium]